MSKDTSLPVIDNPTLSGLKKAHFLTRKLAISIKTPRAVLSTLKGYDPFECSQYGGFKLLKLSLYWYRYIPTYFNAHANIITQRKRWCT